MAQNVSSLPAGELTTPGNTYTHNGPLPMGDMQPGYYNNAGDQDADDQLPAPDQGAMGVINPAVSGPQGGNNAARPGQR